MSLSNTPQVHATCVSSSLARLHDEYEKIDGMPLTRSPFPLTDVQLYQALGRAESMAKCMRSLVERAEKLLEYQRRVVSDLFSHHTNISAQITTGLDNSGQTALRLLCETTRNLYLEQRNLCATAEAFYTKVYEHEMNLDAEIVDLEKEVINREPDTTGEEMALEDKRQEEHAAWMTEHGRDRAIEVYGFDYPATQ